MAGAVDLHSHTTASDGTLAPRELVRLAARHGVRVLAVTDHDSTGGVREAMDEARTLPPLEIVPGLEINCDVPGAGIHVLGYCGDWRPWEFLGAQRERQRSTDRGASASSACRSRRRGLRPREGRLGRPPARSAGDATAAT